MKVTKEFHFDAGHRLSNYTGKCRRFHGHTYHIHITVESDILDSVGMVMDFGQLTKIFDEEIDSKFDHRMMLLEGDPINEAVRKALPKSDDSICWLPYNPTAENMARDIFDIVSKKLKEISMTVTLSKVIVYETPTSYAEVSYVN